MSRLLKIILFCFLTFLSITSFFWISISGERALTSFREHLNTNYDIFWDRKAQDQVIISYFPTPSLTISGGLFYIKDHNNQITLERSTLRTSLSFLSFIKKQYEPTSFIFSGGNASLKPAHYLETVKNNKIKLKFIDIPIHIQIDYFPIIQAHIQNITLQKNTFLNELQITGSLIWNNDILSFNEFRFQPNSYSQKKRGHFIFDISRRQSFVKIKGQNTEEGLIYGDFLFSTTNIKSLRDSFGSHFPFLKIFPKIPVSFSYSSQFEYVENKFTTPNAQIKFADSLWEGTLVVLTNTPRIAVNATLATDIYDTQSNPFLPHSLDNLKTILYRFWNKEFSLASVTDFDLDLRFSVNKLLWNNQIIHDLAANLLIRPEKIELSLVRASLESASIRAKATIKSETLENKPLFQNMDTDETIKNFSLTVNSEALDWAPFFQTFKKDGIDFLMLPSQLLKPDAVKLAIEGSGKRIKDIYSSISGKGQLNYKNLSFSNFDEALVTEESSFEETIRLWKLKKISEIVSHFSFDAQEARLFNGEIRSPNNQLLFSISLANELFPIRFVGFISERNPSQLTSYFVIKGFLDEKFSMRRVFMSSFGSSAFEALKNYEESLFLYKKALKRFPAE